ncbi:heavy metal transporter [Christiangramia fulva]|uniref:Mercuric transport protein MerT n=1 Tax=Christiangramia fulva TaxID=2126553 RepID=A0A2R3Z1S2_9FLAO|nr:mercuric transport protein MerTP [Christiangramia fulva]AVR44206.1 heavy metal transporter [Christiangramia fulva]
MSFLTTNKGKKQNYRGKGATVSGIFAALAASSCCIPPVIAAIAGIGGIAGSLSWLETYRPYLIVLAIFAIGYAWYNYYQRQKSDECCAINAKPKWYQTKTYLLSASLFAALAVAFPYYSGIFFPSNNKEVVVVNNSDLQSNTFNIQGMTCNGCAAHVESEVKKLPGIFFVDAIYEKASAKVEFDRTKVSIGQIVAAINRTGYKVVKKN